jgi:glycosyltransferase involved in cell wall biosynthesis
MISIDVVIPCYKYGRYLRNCVRSVLDQEGVAVRVLIIDDCSPDNTPEIGRTLAAEDSRVEYRRHEKNLRHIATYNEGFEWASSDATLLLSADDLVTPGALTRAAEVLQKHPDVSLVCGKQIVFDEVPPPAPTVASWRHRVVPGPQFIDQMCRTASNPVATPTAVVRTSFLHAIGGYDASLPHTADMHYWLRCAARGSVAMIDADQGYKRMHGANMQVEYVTRRVRDMDQQWTAIHRFFEQDAVLVDGREQLLLAANRSIASQAFWAASEAFDRGQGEQIDELLDFARLRDPDLPRARAWSRLAWKRRLGGRLWGAVRPVVDRFRRQPAVAK